MFSSSVNMDILTFKSKEIDSVLEPASGGHPDIEHPGWLYRSDKE